MWKVKDKEKEQLLLFQLVQFQKLNGKLKNNYSNH